MTTIHQSSPKSHLPRAEIEYISSQTHSETEKTGDDTSEPGSSVSFLRLPESGTEGDESGFDIRPDHFREPSSSAKTVQFRIGRELSGLCRPNLKQYFDDTPPFSLPIGHPTVSFSEPQLYSLLKFMADETLSM